MCQLCLTSCLLLQYTESLIVEHGYTRGEINATTFHLEVRPHHMAFLSMLQNSSFGGRHWKRSSLAGTFG